MSALDDLRTLAGGNGAVSGMLGTCRLESGNVDAFGTEAVGDAFRRSPIADAATANVIEVQGHLAIFGRSEAVIADLFGDAIGRLWRVGQDDPGTPEAAVGVAFDTDLRQARADVFVSAEEHPALAPGAFDRVVALGQDLVRDATPSHATFRARAFAVRAFGDETRGCVLFAIHALAPNPRRVPYLTFAATRWDGSTTQVVRDPVRLRRDYVSIVS